MNKNIQNIMNKNIPENLNLERGWGWDSISKNNNDIELIKDGNGTTYDIPNIPPKEQWGWKLIKDDNGTTYEHRVIQPRHRRQLPEYGVQDQPEDSEVQEQPEDSEDQEQPIEESEKQKLDNLSKAIQDCIEIYKRLS